MQIVECLGILTMQVIEGDLTPMKARKESKSYVIDATTLDILQDIVEKMMISAMEEIEGMYLYVSYATTLDTQQSLVEWTEGILIGIRTSEEITEEVLTV